MSKKKKQKEVFRVNRIRDAAKEAKVSTIVLAIAMDVSYTTVSGWNSNNGQPAIKVLNSIGEFLEEDNINLWESIPRIKTGLAKATQAEYKRLLAEGIPAYISNNGVVTSRFNPEMKDGIKSFIADYKKNAKPLDPEVVVEAGIGVDAVVEDPLVVELREEIASMKRTLKAREREIRKLKKEAGKE